MSSVNVGDVTAGTVTVGAVALTDHMTITDGKNIILDSTNGTKIGTATTQKLGFYNTTPVVQAVATADIKASLVALGLIAGGGATPLNLNSGALSAGALTVTSVVGTGTVALTDTMTITEGKNIVLGTTTGTKIGTGATQKLGFYNATPIVQRDSSAVAAVATTGSAASTGTVYGFTTAAQADGIVALVNELRAAIVALGLIKGS